MQIHNIEIKLRVDDAGRARTAIEALADGPAEALEQRDTYFETGRETLLKLREENGRAALISYQRTLADAPQPSDIRLARLDDAGDLADVLQHALEVLQVVEKTRRLYFVGQTRIHLDRVAGLGDFVELEVVLETGQSEAEGRRIADALLARLDLTGAEPQSASYRDLVSARR